eukprot:gnl/TRDRNA2_/TRDRNA2_133436_c0_seq1.p1 gnl/TRDRNA2_/TRDRNA2_133436_c0~~gnl/TRDRNA2_/TRDRNA2_133436_c0_seq1.p1  ORF type:complete len:406 (+),score=48.60 gnl/TRDRNA2_/TRDRNA2_133436_c0_seq1:97-1314(+)
MAEAAGSFTRRISGSFACHRDLPASTSPPARSSPPARPSRRSFSVPLGEDLSSSGGEIFRPPAPAAFQAEAVFPGASDNFPDESVDVVSAGALPLEEDPNDNPQEGFRNASSDSDQTEGVVRAWRRRAQRRALRHGAAKRNSYLVGRSPGASKIDIDAPRAQPPGSLSACIAQLHVYDLRGVEDTNSIVRNVGLGIFHVGIELYGVEWAFGYLEYDPSGPPVSGVYPVDPRCCPIGTYRESVNLGPVTRHGARDVWWLLGGMASTWLGSDYHPFSKNCLHFCQEVCDRLGLEDVPAWTGRLASAADVLLTPLLNVLDVPPVPVHTIEADGGSDERTPTQSTAAESSSTSSAVGRRTRLSPATAVALDFEEKFGWALMTMLLMEATGRKQDERNIKHRQQCLAGFL